uniref:Uncharacterized protein n=1 Tax=Onchocerca volvulus TaxID=6282 RepID=A0A8R1TU70_ONCVO
MVYKIATSCLFHYLLLFTAKLCFPRVLSKSSAHSMTTYLWSMAVDMGMMDMAKDQFNIVNQFKQLYFNPSVDQAIDDNSMITV